MITEMFRFSDDEIIIKMKYSDLKNLGEEIYYFLNKATAKEDFPYSEQLLDIIRKGNDN